MSGVDQLLALAARTNDALRTAVIKNQTLQQQVEQLRERVTTQEELLEFKRVEIERLRKQLSLGETGAKVLADAKEEIARLRDEVDKCTVVRESLYEALTTANKSVAERNAEIEQLRADLAAMSDSVQVAAQALNDEERENERLRTLLREAEKMWPNPGLSSESASWYRRVREALGDPP